MNSPPATLPRSRAAFTLVEQLLLIGIFAVLLALLIPLGGRAVESSRSSRCVHHLRGLHVAFSLYFSENQGKIPGYREFTKQPDGTILRGDFWSEKVRPYMRTTDVRHFRCPGAISDPANSYGMNASISSDSGSPMRFSNIPYPAKLFLIGDAASNSRITSGTETKNEVAYRHPAQRANFLFLDGHIESYQWADTPSTSNGYPSSSAAYQAFWKGL